MHRNVNNQNQMILNLKKYDFIVMTPEGSNIYSTRRIH